MKLKFFSVASLAIIIIIACSFKKKKEPTIMGQFEPIAVVELFTSQGCSSCPPADQLLDQTIAEADIERKKIFALSFHVDYWNYLGWNDVFSNDLYSQRQLHYVTSFKLHSAYTPQMIVNGSYEFVGSDKNLLSQNLTKALNENAEVKFTDLTATIKEGSPIKIQYAIDGNFADSKINFALISVRETTKIKKGENRGSTLENENVVRQLISRPANAKGVIEFASSPVPEISNLSVIAFVQKTNTLKIIGAAKLKTDQK